MSQADDRDGVLASDQDTAGLSLGPLGQGGPGRGVVLAAIGGALCISTSAVVMRLAGSSASTLALGRSGFALPVLAVLVYLERRRHTRGATAETTVADAQRDGAAAQQGDTAGRPPGRPRGRYDGAAIGRASGDTGGRPPGRPRGRYDGAAIGRASGGTGGRSPGRQRRLARLAGVLLAGDLVLWAHSISDIGAGLGTVLSNLQVIVVPVLAWALLGERPRRSLLAAVPVMLFGLVLVGGLLTGGGYGVDPGLGVVYGIGVALLYSGYILLLRHAAAAPGKTAGRVLGTALETLFEATLGAACGSLALGLALRDFRLGPAWPALGWLVVLALTSGVLGWLLLTVALPRLPAWLASSLLLVQPAGSVLLGAVFLRERPTPAQLAGVIAMLAGVVIASRGSSLRKSRVPARREKLPRA